MTLGTTNTLAPRVLFEILSGPASLSATDLQRSLISLVYTHEKGERPKFTIEFDNTSGKVFNFGVLLAGLALKIRFGYQNVISRPFVAYLRRVAASSVGEPGVNPRSPRPDIYGKVKFEAKAIRWEVTHTRSKNHRNAHVYTGYNVTISDAVRQIARAYGFRENKIFIQKGLADGSAEPVLDQVNLSGIESAEQFLISQAERRGFEHWTTDSEFHFHAHDWNEIDAVEEIAYFKGPDLLEYSIDGDFNLSTSRVTGKTIDPLKGGIVSYVIGEGGVAAIGTIRSPGGQRSKAVPDSIAPTETVLSISKRAAEKAARRLISQLNNRWKLNVTLIGNPAIFKGTALSLNNFGPLIDGSWFVEGVEHSFTTSDGYRTKLKLTAKKAATGGGGRIKIPTLIIGENGIAAIGTISTSAEPSQAPGTRKKKRKPRPKKYKPLKLGAPKKLKRR